MIGKLYHFHTPYKFPLLSSSITRGQCARHAIAEVK
jgi:hypothetical protein